MTGGSGLSRLATNAALNLGFDPASVGIDRAVMSALADPASQTQGLFKSMQPFEERETARQVAGLRDMMGTMGGRFSRNLGAAEADLRSNLAAGFGQNREQALLQAGAQRDAALANILSSQLAAQQTGLGSLMQFMQPGTPVWREGLAPGLLGAGANLLGMRILAGGFGGNSNS